MKKLMLLIFISFHIFILTAESSSKKNDKNIIITKSDINGREINLEVKKGAHWSQKKNIGFISVNIIPQIAVWVEDRNGNYIDTLYVTKAFAKQNWAFMKKETDKTYRTTSLPFWMNKRLKAGLKSPTSALPLPDSETGATPKGNFTIKSKIKPELKEFAIIAEFNKSFDVNENFHANEKDMTDTAINGQPSVVYQTVINMNKPKESYNMMLVGYGGEKGDDANLYTDVEKLTTAKSIIESITVYIK